MKQKIELLLQESVKVLQKKGAWPDFTLPGIEVSRPKNEQFGEYSCTLAMALAKVLGKSPLVIAEELRIATEAHLNDAIDLKDVVDGISVVAPGYINITLKHSYFTCLAERIIQQGSEYGSQRLGEGKRVMIEFISANPTGPIHLGNARGGPSGDILANVLEKNGYQVDREYYVNDYGNQVRVLGHSLIGDEEAQYKGEYIDELRALGLQENVLTKENRNPAEVGFWATQKILETIIKPTCEKAGIHFKTWFSEKSLHASGAVDAVLADLKVKDLAYEKDDALWFRSTQFGDDKDRVLIKSDALHSKTYTATDLAYHKNKIERGYDIFINIQGADHLSQAAVVKRFIEDVLDAKDRLHLIITQFVRILKDGVEVKMSKRKGIYFAWDDLIEEVGKDAVRFIFASYAPTSHIDFDINAAREKSNQNPVYYVQYAHARIASIVRKAKELGLSVVTKENELGASSYRQQAANHILHPKEVALLRELSVFPELVAEVAQNYEVHRLPHYAIRLADTFHSFYSECKVIDEQDSELTNARLRSVVATQVILAETLRLIGVSAPESM